MAQCDCHVIKSEFLRGARNGYGAWRVTVELDGNTGTLKRGDYAAAVRDACALLKARVEKMKNSELNAKQIKAAANADPANIARGSKITRMRITRRKKRISA